MLGGNCLIFPAFLKHPKTKKVQEAVPNVKAELFQSQELSASCGRAQSYSNDHPGQAKQQEPKVYEGVAFGAFKPSLRSVDCRRGHGMLVWYSTQQGLFYQLK